MVWTRHLSSPGTNGQSNRKAEHYFLNGKLAAVRMDDSSIILIQQPYAYTQSGYQGEFTHSNANGGIVGV